ncbi:MAG: hypothetical protein R2824_01885 [Saprospiraceae bacterium]|nr:hypothetical protein [Lewinella sp.]
MKDGSNGKKGLSWEEAFGDLHQALKSAKPGDEIWVAAGIYVPTYDGDRTVPFRLVNEVSMFGGFAGHEKAKEERNFKLNETILSGEIGTASADDNSYTIIYAENVSMKTVIDGFVISDANANGTDAGVHPNTCGAAWFNIGSSPFILNCTFRQNASREGAAIYNYAGKNGKSSPRILACNFVDNKADLDGGAIFNNGDNGECLPRIESCYFENNISTYGAGIMNRASNGVTKATVIECKFVNNKSLVRGSAIYNHRDKSGLCTSMVKDCIFEDNLASVGKDISNTLNNGMAGGN